MLLERRRVLKLAALGAATACRPALAPATRPSSPAARAPTAFPLAERSIDELQAMMERGEQTSVSLVEQYLRRIEAIDRHGPKLAAVLELNPDALATAALLDRERAGKGARGPLHGVPVMLKDNIATADRMQTTAGSLALVGHRPARDAFIAARLRAAGAVLLGKTNMSEWANIRGERATSGWSSRGGQCRNPYAPTRNPCGSSSGSAAATSASLCAVAIGTETRGSIVCPASACGIVGVKPTLGLVSRSGIIPVAASFDTAGPMARTVRDAALLLGAVQGVDRHDETTAAAGPYAARDYTVGLRPDALRGARIGVARSFFGFHPRVDALAGQALVALAAAGAVLVDPVDLSFPRALEGDLFEVMLHELKAGLNEYLLELAPGATLTSLADVVAFNTSHATEVLAHFGQEHLVEATSRGPLEDPGYVAALERVRRAAREDGIDRVVTQHQLDAIVAPTGSPAWLTDTVLGDHFIGGSSTPAAMAGYPNVTVPAGHIEGLPVGVSLFGPAWSEPRLLALAYAFEQVTHHRRPPNLETAS